MSKEKTAEWVLEKYETFVKYNTTPIFLKENVLKAMQEYAEQYHKQQLEGLPSFDEIDEKAKSTQGVENLHLRRAFCIGAEFMKTQIIEGNKKEK